ncbi:hypothetical protein GQR86_02525 [Providencia vermicola]|nr:hypothetical protein [Providencia sp. G1(2023)]MBC8652440.1 hypothetical protein [Providencia vermicola]
MTPTSSPPYLRNDPARRYQQYSAFKVNLYDANPNIGILYDPYHALELIEFI